jgi:hypothetical protein
LIIWGFLLYFIPPRSALNPSYFTLSRFKPVAFKLIYFDSR